MIIAMILAGGVGSRVGADVPKQFIEVFDKPILAYTTEIFQEHPKVDAIEIVCHAKWLDHCRHMVKKYNLSKVKWIVQGGDTFQESTMNGINNLASLMKEGELNHDDLILVQYGAAPFTSKPIVDDVIKVAGEKGNAVTTIPCYQLLGSNDEGGVSKTWIDRDKCIQIACPYGFSLDYLIDVYKRSEERGLLDTVEPHLTTLMYELGDTLNQAYGNQTNIKITTAEDVELFKGYILYKRTNMKR